MREPKPVHVTQTRYYGPDGKRCGRDAPGAVARRERSDSYYVWLGKGSARKRYALGTTDRAQAYIEMRRLQRELADRAAGITDEFTDQAARPLREHLEGWIASVAAKGTSAKQLRLLRKSVETLAGLARWDRLPQLSADSCLKALAALQATADAHCPAGRSAQTRNHYLSHVKQFARWAWEDGRLRRNPLAALKPAAVDADRRHDRRAPTQAEVARLMAHLASAEAPARYGMAGPQRALGYKTAMATGLRAQELRSLGRESFDLAAAVVTVRAAYDKRRRPVRQPLPAWLVGELRAWFDSGGGCWDGFPADHPGRVLTADLAAAGVAYELAGPDGPLFLDFHSLRVWYCTEIANQPGISPKAMMTLCRHSTAQLTLKTYAKSREPELRAAVEKLPPPPGPPAFIPPPPPPPA